MKKLGEMLAELFEAAGYEQSNEKVAEIVKNTISLDLPDGFEAKFHDTFYKPDRAKQVFKAELMSAFADNANRELRDFLKAEGFSETEISEMSGSKMYRENLVTAIKKATEKARSEGKGGNTAAIEELKKQLAEADNRIKAELEKALQPVQSENQILKSRLLENLEARLFDFENLNVPKLTKAATVKAAVNAYLDSIGGEISLDPISGTTKIHKKNEKDVPLYLQGKEVNNFDDIKSLAVQTHLKDYLIQPGGNGGSGGQTQTTTTTATTANAGAQKPNVNTLAASNYDKLLAGFSNE
jgi:F0F1-type ATP synthase membrane subunit b/b'